MFASSAASALTDVGDQMLTWCLLSTLSTVTAADAAEATGTRRNMDEPTAYVSPMSKEEISAEWVEDRRGKLGDIAQPLTTTEVRNRRTPWAAKRERRQLCASRCKSLTRASKAIANLALKAAASLQA